MIYILDDFTGWEQMKNKVIHGDALELLRKLPDNSVDLVLTDPPYGIGRISKHSDSKQQLATNSCKNDKMNWNNDIPSLKIFEEIFRVSKNQIIFGGNYFIEHLKNSRCWICWDKCNPNTTFADIELAWTSFDKNSELIRFMWNGMLQGKSISEGHIQQGNKKLNEKRSHPTQKPIMLWSHIVSKYSEYGQSILDPFMGSWTTAKACQELGRDFIGCDLEEDYCKIGERRLAEQPLFTV